MSAARLRALVLLLVTAAFGAAPLIVPPFKGYDPAQFPVLIPRPAIQPAGYAFSIWGVIYLWLALHALLGLFRRAETAAWDRPRLPLILAIGLGAAWLSIAHAAPVTATVAIWIMAAAALWAFLSADPTRDRWTLSAPTAIFAGWLSAAAAVSTGVVLAGHGWLSDRGAALAMLAVILALSLAIQTRQPRMPVYGMTVIWALLGIILANRATEPTVALAALAAGLAMAAALLWARRAPADKTAAS